MKPTIEQLLQQSNQLWRGRQTQRARARRRSSGYRLLDQILPEQGWPERGLMDIIHRHEGIGELQLLSPLMRACTLQKRWLVWVMPTYIPYPPALQAAGIDLRYVLVIKPNDIKRQGVKVIEKCLLQPACGLVLLWDRHQRFKFSMSQLRRLQLAAETGVSLGVRFMDEALHPSCAMLRLQITPQDKVDSQTGQTRDRTLKVQILKARGHSRYHTTQIRVPLMSQFD